MTRSAHGDGRGDARGQVAPVIPLFGAGGGADLHNGHDPGAGVIADAHETDDASAENADAVREDAERTLVRRLRTRQLSIAEARTVLVGRDLPADQIDEVVTDFVRRGYLDDRELARQLVRAGVERKGQGRRVIAQTLSKRAVSRVVVDEVMAELPDDDAERALEFARRKAPAMARLDHDVALRRLAGQLARRGYGAQALDAARQALDEL